MRSFPFKMVILTSACASCFLSANTSTHAANTGAVHGVYKITETQNFNIHTISDTLETQSINFVKSVVDDGIAFLNNQNLSENKRKESFAKLLKTNFDMKTIGRFALGSYWRQASKEQQKEYLSLFEKMIIDVYSRRFGEYDGQSVTVKKARKQGKSDAIVSSVIVQNGGPDIALDWRIRQKKNGQLKVIDIMVEGVSMSLTQRSDFASVIQRGGGKIDILLNHLRVN